MRSRSRIPPLPASGVEWSSRRAAHQERSPTPQLPREVEDGGEPEGEGEEEAGEEEEEEAVMAAAAAAVNLGHHSAQLEKDGMG